MVPRPTNEPVLGYAPGSPERAALKAALAKQSSEVVEIPLTIGGERVKPGGWAELRSPHRKKQVIARHAVGGVAETERAIAAAQAAAPGWARTPFETRAAIFLRAAELLATKYRATMNAATMLGQSKTAHQAEIDSACELVDFFRFNVAFAASLHESEQPISPAGAWNRVALRPLEGFVYAVTPFNFTAIGGNLPSAPALMGNVVVWKPSEKALLSNALILRILEEAGLPPGVINLIVGDPVAISGAALRHRDLAGLHFTGSTAVFHSMWRTIGESMAGYRSFPRLVGETGGKGFLVAHPSADADALATAIVRGGYEYQGQKCSALSRAYVPRSLWDRIKPRLAETINSLRVGDVADFSNFMGAVIDERSFQKLRGKIEAARGDRKLEIIAGGSCDDTDGWFVRPTLVRTDDPRHELMGEELFGPFVTLFVYPDAEWEQTLAIVDQTSPYALTGAVFATERAAIARASDVLVNAAGNFYVNDKPTGAVVGQQPFGGARGSGTNDKAGSALNLMRWTSARTIKETLAPPTHWSYPFLSEP